MDKAAKAARREARKAKRKAERSVEAAIMWLQQHAPIPEVTVNVAERMPSGLLSVQRLRVPVVEG